MTNDEIMAKAARLLVLQQQIADLSAEASELSKALDALEPGTYRGHGVRVARTPVRTVDQKAAQEDYPQEQYPGLYKRKVTDAFQLEPFKVLATEQGVLGDYQKVTYRNKIEAEATAYALPVEDEDPGF